MQSPLSNLSGRSFTSRISAWWHRQTPEAQTQIKANSGFGFACALTLVLGLPLMSKAASLQSVKHDWRVKNEMLAEVQDAGALIRADKTVPSLLRQDWLRSVEYSLERDPSSALSQTSALERDRAALKSLRSFEPVHLSRAEDIAAQTQCLAQAVYYEARSERTEGQLAVAEVIMNRVRDHRYPNTICDVVFQGATRTTGCQFTFTCDGAMRKQPKGWRWEKARTIASHVVMGLNEQKTRNATHYHATYVNPVWNSGLMKTRQIGTHIFYRFPRGGEWQQASARQKARLAQRRSGLRTLNLAAAAPEAEAKLIVAVAGVPAEAKQGVSTASKDVSASEPKSEDASPVIKRTYRRIVDGVVVEESDVPL
ncbi:MAG: cell wall hydrolase [Pseudomonadota bacterium]